MRTVQKKILIVDDEPSFIRKMRLGFREYIFTEALNAKESQQSLTKNNFDLILLDLKLDSSSEVLDGLELIEPIKESLPDTPLVVVTADEKTETIVTAMKLGADDFLRKSSFDLLSWKKKFDLLIENKKLLLENKKLKTDKRDDFPPFIGESSEIKEIKRSLQILGETTDVTVLITGETGVGKEVAARYLHQHGPRKDKPFVAVDFTFPDTLLESSLFGHKRGAFTGANYDRKGFFRKADGGTLFLDEIGEIDAQLQVKLLRFLETKKIQVVGDDRDMQLDVQIIVATNRNLKQMVQQGKFRADLYYRIKNFQIEIPPLRERVADIKAILDFYLQRRVQKSADKIITKTALDKLYAYHWPGNVRELLNAVDAMFLKRRLQRKKRIDMACLPEEINSYAGGKPGITAQKDDPVRDNIQHQIAETELQAIEQALRKTFGQKQAAAELLGMTADQMRYRVLKWQTQAPEILSKYSMIVKKYKIEA